MKSIFNPDWSSEWFGTYVRVKPDSSSIGFLKRYLLNSTPGIWTDPEDLHCTVVWSRESLNDEAISWLQMHLNPTTKFLAQTEYLTSWVGHNDKKYVVLRLNSPDLMKLNKKFREEFGLSNSNFAEYIPHITLLEDAPGSTSRVDVPLRPQPVTLTNLCVSNAKRF